MKEIIINADEFGLTRGINRAIIESMEKGVVSATSIMYGGADIDYAIDYARKQKIDAGVHLNLTYGSPLVGRNKTTHNNGVFYNRRQLLYKCALKRIEYREIYTEFEAQILFFMDRGLEISHLDTHQHIHTVSPIYEAVRDLALKYDLIMRLPQETIVVETLRTFQDLYIYIKKKMISWRCQRLRHDLIDDGVKITSRFLSPFGLIPRPQRFEFKHFKRILDYAETGLNEYMAHPGYLDETFNNFSSWAHQREDETAIYTSSEAKELLGELGLRLIDFRTILQRRNSSA